MLSLCFVQGCIDCAVTQANALFCNFLLNLYILTENSIGSVVRICISVHSAKKLAYLQVATLRSAVKLEQEQQFLIAKKLQELTGSKNIKLKPVIDESLIAGFTVSYGSAQIDMSVKGQLELITNELEGKNVGMLAS